MLGWPSTLTPLQWRVANGGRSSPPLSLVQDSWLRGEGPSLVLGTVNSPPVHRDRHVHAAATGPSVERRVVKISLHCSTKYGARLENQSIPPLLASRGGANRHVSLRISAPARRRTRLRFSTRRVRGCVHAPVAASVRQPRSNSPRLHGHAPSPAHRIPHLSHSQAAISPMGIVKPTLVIPSRDDPVAMPRSGKEAV